MNLINNPVWGSIKLLSTPFILISNKDADVIIEEFNFAVTGVFPDLEIEKSFFDLFRFSAKDREGLLDYLSSNTEKVEFYLSEITLKNTHDMYNLHVVPFHHPEKLVHMVQLSHLNQEQLLNNFSYSKGKYSDHLLLGVNERNFRSLIQQAPVGICVIKSEDLKVLEWNYQFQETIGRKFSDVKGLTIWEVVPEVADIYRPLMDDVIESGIPYVATEREMLFFKHNILTQVIVDFVFEPIRDMRNKVNNIMIVTIDVTDKVLARRKIEDIEERNRLAVEAAEIGTFEYKFADELMVASDRMKQIFGVTEDLYHKDIIKLIHPQDVQVREDAFGKARVDGKLFYEARIMHTDGAYRWVRIQAKVYMDSDHKPFKILGTILDITEYKKLQQQKEDFVSIASHELKTPITSLKASLQLLEKFKDDLNSPVSRKLINQSTKSMGKISKLVDDLLNVSRMNIGQLPLNKNPFKLNSLIEEIVKGFVLSHSIKIEVIGKQDIKIIADEHRIDQVITNFIANIYKHAKGVTEIKVVSEVINADSVEVSVIDNGKGIDAQKIPFIFDRYYQGSHINDNMSGLGLGLYIAADIIQRHGGEIGVDSILDKGSRFWFKLPLKSS